MSDEIARLKSELDEALAEASRLRVALRDIVQNNDRGGTWCGKRAEAELNPGRAPLERQPDT